MTTLKIKVKPTTIKGTDGFTGTVSITGLKPAKLARKDGETLFPTTSALKTVARGLGKRLDADVVYDEPMKMAAKKSVKKSCCSSKDSCCKSTSKTKTKK